MGGSDCFVRGSAYIHVLRRNLDEPRLAWCQLLLEKEAQQVLIRPVGDCRHPWFPEAKQVIRPVEYCHPLVPLVPFEDACGRDHVANGANPCPGYHTGRCLKEGLIPVDPCVDHDAFGCHSSRVSQ
jgi:hypothetical protein